MPTSLRLWAFERGIWPAQTALETMEMGNLAPSSLWDFESRSIDCMLIDLLCPVDDSHWAR